MLLLYFLVAGIGMIFFGLAGAGAFAGSLYAYRLNSYRYRFMGLPDRRNFLARFWRLWKFSLYQPVLCIALALLLVTLLSIFIKPLSVARIFGGAESDAALTVGSWENKIYGLTEWLQNGNLLNALLTMTLVLLFTNLLWPSLTIFKESAKLRVMSRNIMIFLTTFCAFTFVSGSGIKTNRSIITAKLRKDINKNLDDINQFNSEAAAYQLVKESIENLTPDQIRQITALVKTVAAVEAAKEVSEQMGKDAGKKLYTETSPPPRNPVVKDPLAEVKDWPTLEERRLETSKHAKRSTLVRKAARDSLLATVDQLSIDVANQLGGSMNRISKVVLGSFFSSMAESVTEFCATLTPRSKLSTDKDILKHLDDRVIGMDADRFFASWLDDIPEAHDSEKLAAILAKRVNSLDADIKVKSAAKAAKAAADAAEAAKAAKAAKSLIKIIL